MFARVSTYRTTDADQLLEGFQSVTGALEEIDGFSRGYFLVDRSEGTAISITLWDSEEAMTASAAQADELRKTGTDTGGGSIESVEEYEVGLTVGVDA